jgi:hypothetical protein
MEIATLVVAAIAALAAVSGVAVGIRQNREAKARWLRQVQPIVRLGDAREAPDQQGPALRVTLASIGAQADVTYLAFRFGRRIYWGRPAIPPHAAPPLTYRLGLVGELDHLEQVLQETLPTETLCVLLHDMDGRWWDGLSQRPLEAPRLPTPHTAQAIYDWAHSRQPGVARPVSRWRKALHGS